MLRAFVIAALAFWLSLSAAQAEEAAPRPDLLGFPSAVLEIQTQQGVQSLRVELAVDPRHWQQGLMFREQMDDDAGMLFVFPQPQVLSFWMKNTLLPLDMLFADGDGRVVHIAYDAVPGSTDSISSQVPAQLVLEVKAGQADALGLAIGDQLLFPLGNITPAPEDL